MSESARSWHSTDSYRRMGFDLLTFCSRLLSPQGTGLESFFSVGPEQHDANDKDHAADKPPRTDRLTQDDHAE
jgi:hypothetical protein